LTASPLTPEGGIKEEENPNKARDGN
jgi:hypothetical protein